MEKSLMVDPSRCRLLPEGLSSLREEVEAVAEGVVVVFEAEVVVVVVAAAAALVVVRHLMSGVETGLVLTVLVAT